MFSLKEKNSQSHFQIIKKIRRILVEKLEKVVFLAVSLILISLSSVAEANLLANPGFEEGNGGWFGATTIPGWTIWGQSGWHHSDYNHTTGGSKAIKTWWSNTGIFQDFQAASNTAYNISGFAYSPTSDKAKGWDGLLKVEWFNGAAKVGEEDIGRFLGDGVDSYNVWKGISKSVVSPAGINAGRIVTYLVDNGRPQKGGAVGWDDISVTSSYSPKPNVVNNNSFETGDTGGWIAWAVDANVTADIGRYGYDSLKLALPAWSQEGALLQEFTSFLPGEPIYASVWIKTFNLNGSARLKLEFWNATNKISEYQTTAANPSANWTQKSISTTVPQNTTKVKYLLYLTNVTPGTSGEAYFDDAYLSNSAYSPYKKGINCGGPVYQTAGGKRYEADQEFSNNEYGHTNGTPESTQDTIVATPDVQLYQTGLWGDWRYLFNLPNGIYNVKLQFAEIWFGRNGEDAKQNRVFNVYLEDKLVLEKFDIYKLAGHDRALDYDFIVEVKDGQLNIDSLSLMDNSKISAIYVEEAGWDNIPPQAPADFAANPKDAVVFLDWKDNTENDICAYEVYRSIDGGSTYSKIGKVKDSKFKDVNVTNATAYYYYVKALDYFDNESDSSVALQATPSVPAARNFWQDIPSFAWKRYLGDVPENTASSNPKRGIALGGFGAGSFMYNIDGTFGPWNVKVSRKGYKKLDLEGAAFHIYQKIGSNSAVVKTLSAAEGLKPAWNRINVGDAEYYALQPKGWVTYGCFDVDLSCEFYSPIIANNYKETSYPIAVWQWLVSNPTNQIADVSIMLTWPNVEGTYLGSVRKGYQNEFRALSDISGVVLKAVDAANGVEAQNSEWCVATKGQASYITSWNVDAEGVDILNNFADDGALSNAPLDASNSAAAVACKVTLAPGEEAVIPMVISWDMPVVEFGSGTQWWRKYCEYFDRLSDNSFDIACAALQYNAFDQWREKIDAWMRPFAYDSNYPDWLKSAAFNELYYAQFGNCFYESGLKSGHSQEFMGLHPEDHKHFILESVPWANTSPSDLRQYYSIVYAAFWPEIEKETLINYADGIIYYNGLKGWPSGNMLHDFGDPDYVDPFFEFDAYRNIIPQMPYWKDTPSAYIQQCWRYYYIYKDRNFLDYVWPACKATYGFMKTTDTDGDYLPNNVGNDNTYDYMSLNGTSAYCGTLWVGALEAIREMARVENDPIITEVENWLSNAKTNLDSQLWMATQGYYKKDSSSTAIMADGLNGELYCRQWGLEDVLPNDRMRSHLQKVYEKCVVPMKDFNSDGIGDVGAVIFVNEDGSIGLDKVVTAVNYHAAALMRKAGLNQESLQTAYGSYYLTYLEESTAYWFSTPEIWNSQGINPIPPGITEQYARPMAVWEYILSIRNPFSEHIAVASSENSSVADNVLDGNLTTAWSSDAKDEEWIYVYFLAPKQFNTVRLVWAAAYGKAYNIQISDDGVNWTTIYAESNGDGATDVINVTPQTARYVRMLGVQRATSSGYSLYEFEIL